MSDSRKHYLLIAGSGILALFACQQGARKVYAIEASDMAMHARKLIAANGFADRVEVRTSTRHHVA